MTTHPKAQLHITVGSYPTRGGSLEQDVRLVKAAILYADKVSLYSPTYAMLSMAIGLKTISPEQQAQFSLMTLPFIADSRAEEKKITAALQGYLRRSRNNHLTVQDKKIQRLIADNWTNIKQVVEEKFLSKGFNDLENLSQVGLLEIHRFGISNDSDSILEFLVDCIAVATGSPKQVVRQSAMSARQDEMIKEFVDGVSTAISSGETYPLFDLQTGNLVKVGIKDGVFHVSDAGVERGKHIGLAGHLFERLPLFEDASLDEVVDIRRELEKYLVRYRQALIQFSTAIRSASWDDDFPLDAEEVFRRSVAPAILDIEEAVKTNKYLISLLRTFTKNPLILPSSAVLSVIMSQFSSLPDEVIKGLGLATLTTTSALVYGAYDEWRKDRQAIEQNNLYFYYRAKEWFQ